MYLLTHLQNDLNTKLLKDQTTISHLMNSNGRKLIDEVEEVRLLAESDNSIKYKLLTSVMISLIEALF
jgi:hypothetical protein